MRETRQSGSEGGVRLIPHPYPYPSPELGMIARGGIPTYFPFVRAGQPFQFRGDCSGADGQSSNSGFSTPPRFAF
jgi:hypothetical protein